MVGRGAVVVVYGVMTGGGVVSGGFEEEGQDSGGEAGDPCDEEGGGPCVCVGGAYGGGVFDVSGNLWAYDTCGTVGEKDVAVVSSDVFVAEEVGGGCGEEGKVAAEVEADDAGTEDEANLAGPDLEEGEHHDALEQAHGEDGGFASDFIGEGTPYDATDAVENGVEGHGGPGGGTCGCCVCCGTTGLEGVDAEEFDAADDHESGHGGCGEDEEEHVELGCSEHLSFTQFNGTGVGQCRRFPAFGLVVIGRVDHPFAANEDGEEEGATIEEEDGLDSGESQEAVGGVEKSAEPAAGEFDPNGSAEAEAGHSDPGNHAFVVGEPFDAYGDRYDVGESDACAADDADADDLDGEGAPEEATEDVAQSEDDAAQDGDGSWADFGLQASCDDHDDGEAKESDGEDPLCLCSAKAVAPFVNGEFELSSECAPGVNGPQAELD